MVGQLSSRGSAVRRIRACAVLLAIIAVVFSGFAPGLHRIAMAHMAGDDALALCTSDGAPAADSHDGGPSRQAADDCCGLCILGGAGFVAPLAAFAAPPHAVASADLPTGTTAAVRRAPTGPPLPARGPPLLS